MSCSDECFTLDTQLLGKDLSLLSVGVADDTFARCTMVGELDDGLSLARKLDVADCLLTASNVDIGGRAKFK